MSWIVSNVGRPFFYHKWKLEDLSICTYSDNSKKNQRPRSLAQSTLKVEKIVKFLIFVPLIVFGLMKARVIRQIFKLQLMISKRTPDVLTLFASFYDLSVSHNLFSKAETRDFGASGNQRI